MCAHVFMEQSKDCSLHPGNTSLDGVEAGTFYHQLVNGGEWRNRKSQASSPAGCLAPPYCFSYKNFFFVL